MTDVLERLTVALGDRYRLMRELGRGGMAFVAAAPRIAPSPLRDRRDILLIDTRGTGSSAPLDCAFQTGHVLGFLRDFLPPEQVRACRDSLAGVADLAQYVTPNVVDDLDGVRRALGIAQVTLWGSSGGTRRALVWLRRHPAGVRSAILRGSRADRRPHSAHVRGRPRRMRSRVSSRNVWWSPPARARSPTCGPSSAPSWSDWGSSRHGCA